MLDSAIFLSIRELAAEISIAYKDKGKILCVGLLNGAFIFVADLVRHLTVPYEIDFMVVSSYGKYAYTVCI